MTSTEMSFVYDPPDQTSPTDSGISVTLPPTATAQSVFARLQGRCQSCTKCCKCKGCTQDGYCQRCYIRCRCAKERVVKKKVRWPSWPWPCWVFVDQRRNRDTCRWRDTPYLMQAENQNLTANILDKRRGRCPNRVYKCSGHGIVGQYCKYHTCKYQGDGGGECARKKHYDKTARRILDYCKEHYFCIGDYDAGYRPRDGRIHCPYRRTGGPSGVLYCRERHICLYKGGNGSTCEARRQGLYYPTAGSRAECKFCKRHTCEVENCYESVAHRGAKGCVKHTCHADKCRERVPGRDPNNQKTYNLVNEDYCQTHRRCPVAGCGREIFTYATHRTVAKFCWDHFCDTDCTIPCKYQRMTGAGVTCCKYHKCAVQGCRKTQAEPVPSPEPIPLCQNPDPDFYPDRPKLYCKGHKCEVESCANPKHGNSKAMHWCENHMCEVALKYKEKCDEPREGTAANPRFCKNHPPCPVTHCERWRMRRTNGKLEKTCAHRKSHSVIAIYQLQSFSRALNTQSVTIAWRCHAFEKGGGFLALTPTHTDSQVHGDSGSTLMMSP
ncbi:hypothetical protein F4778DRAFT_298880 [Xylariomycetidae sp. FL2044]|nr:hypothetical protein F4778DRAFT_298880 [Xylariomycetidae sp. FL2044]